MFYNIKGCFNQNYRIKLFGRDLYNDIGNDHDASGGLGFYLWYDHDE